MSLASRVRLLCVPFGLGAGVPEMAAGPSVLLEALVQAGLQFPVEWVQAPEADGLAADGLVPGVDGGRRRLARIHRVGERLRAQVEAALRRGEFPLVLGGDHTTALGAFSGLRRARPGQNLGIVWLDAHPDLNTPGTTPSHNAHGMPLAALLGYGDPLLTGVGGGEPKLRPEQVILVGARSFDPGEAGFLSCHPELLLISAGEWRRDSAAATRHILARAAGFEGLHLSFDLDVVDPAQAPGVATPVLNGPSAAEMQGLVRALLGTGKVLSAEVAEYFPARDPDRRTARLVVALVRDVAASVAPVLPCAA